MRRQFLALSCGVLLLAACSSDDDGGTDTSPTTTAEQPTITAGDATTTTAAASEFPPELTADGRVAFAETVNNFVLNTVIAYGEQGLDMEAIAAAILDVYPSLSVRGSAVAADGTNVSIKSNTIDDKNVDGPDNPWYVAVATMQVSGECFGAALYGHPLPTERFDVVDPADLTECTADAVYDALVEALG